MPDRDPPSALISPDRIDVRPIVPGERAALLALFADLAPPEWAAPTACPGWRVTDVANHLLGGDLGVLAWRRDGHADPGFASGLDPSAWTGLVAAIDRHNGRWIEATRRLSPRLTRELLAVTGGWVDAYWGSLDLDAPGVPVDWAGPEPAPVWLDIAREYTERWVHQQQIREAVGRPLLDEPRWLAPVIATFARALPHALRDTPASDGAVARLVVSGPAGGAWEVIAAQGGWRRPAPDDPVGSPSATLTLDASGAWRLWTRGIDLDRARASAVITGDPALAEAMLKMVTVIVGE